MGMHYGHLHEADLGDGLGKKEEHFLARQHYIPVIGTCWESVRGGHHFRAWRQNGTVANSGAWFVGASKEKDSSRNHKITEDGYNLGRDFVVERAVAGSRWRGMWWKAEVEWREGLLQRGRRGTFLSSTLPGGTPILIRSCRCEPRYSARRPRRHLDRQKTLIRRIHRLFGSVQRTTYHRNDISRPSLRNLLTHLILCII